MALVTLGGTAFFRVDGTQYSLLGTFSVDLGGLTREAVPGADGMHGFKTKYRPPMVEAELSDSAQTSLAVLQSTQGSTITFALDNGKTYILVNAWLEGDLKLDAGDAKLTTKFSGLQCYEQLS